LEDILFNFRRDGSRRFGSAALDCEMLRVFFILLEEQEKASSADS
jgi:hypothetical protein